MNSDFFRFLYLQDNHTFRIRYPLPQFLKVATQTVEKWSNQYVIGLKNFALKPTISLELWTNSYNWARSNVNVKIVGKNKEQIVIEVEAQIVRATKSTKRGVVVPMVSSSNSLNHNFEMVNLDLEQLFDSEEKEVPAKETDTRRRAKRKLQSWNNEVARAVKRRCVVTKSSNRQNVFDLEKEEKSFESIPVKKTVKRRCSDQDLLPAFKRRRVVMRSLKMKKSDRKLAAAKNDVIGHLVITESSKIQPSSQASGPNTRNKRHRLIRTAKSQSLSETIAADKRTVKRRRVVEQSSDAISSNQELLPSSSQMVDREVEMSPIDLSKLSTSTTKDYEAYKRLFLKWTTTIVKEDVLLNSSCNCPAFGTEYICKHIVGLAIRLKLVTPPPEAKTIPIGEKRKPGRPAKTKPALMIQ